jgi:AcrR family transcriptional regulator
MVTKGRANRPASPRPEPRNRDATRERILAAVGVLLAREGFSGLGVNAVAREARVDKVLIYRYFGGIDALLDAWGRVALGESFGGAGAPEAGAKPGAATAADRAAAALLAFTRSARGSPQALEIIRWELSEDNALTRRLAQLRESAGLAELARLGIDENQAGGVDLPAVAALLSAGLLHLALRARTAPRWLEVPIRTKQGWERLERAAAELVRVALSGTGPRAADPIPKTP